jgi:antitoxin component YwqK of YwqJK toxin-antitoxin module
MYRKLLYNSNCVFDIESNVVVFDFNKEWSDYLDWIATNPELENKIEETKQVKRRWNQGLPNRNNNKELKHHENGDIFYEKIYNGDVLKYHTEYFFGGKIHKEISYRNDFKIERKYNDLNNISNDGRYMLSMYSKKFYKKNELQKSITYYKTSNKIHRYIKKSTKDSFIYKEYYDTGVLRSVGALDIRNKMLGEWIFYSRTGIIESKHELNNGILIQTSTTYNELGEIKNIIRHG